MRKGARENPRGGLGAGPFPGALGDLFEVRPCGVLSRFETQFLGQAEDFRRAEALDDDVVNGGIRTRIAYKVGEEITAHNLDAGFVRLRSLNNIGS